MVSPALNSSIHQGMQEHIRKTQDILAATDYNAVAILIEKLHQAYDRRNRVFLFGNGGSAACASHFAEDLAKGIIKDFNGQKRLRVLSLTDSVPFISALGNDCGYETVFREQLATNADAGDIAIGISGSGNSPNVLRAIEWGRQNGLYTVGITGFNGGKLKGLADLSIHYEIPDMEIAENAHLIVLHLVVGGLRKLVNS